MNQHDEQLLSDEWLREQVDLSMREFRATQPQDLTDAQTVRARRSGMRLAAMVILASVAAVAVLAVVVASVGTPK